MERTPYRNVFKFKVSSGTNRTLTVSELMMQRIEMALVSKHRYITRLVKQVV